MQIDTTPLERLPYTTILAEVPFDLGYTPTEQVVVLWSTTKGRQTQIHPMGIAAGPDNGCRLPAPDPEEVTGIIVVAYTEYPEDLGPVIDYARVTPDVVLIVSKAGWQIGPDDQVRPLTEFTRGSARRRLLVDREGRGAKAALPRPETDRYMLVTTSRALRRTGTSETFEGRVQAISAWIDVRRGAALTPTAAATLIHSLADEVICDIVLANLTKSVAPGEVALYLANQGGQDQPVRQWPMAMFEGKREPDGDADEMLRVLRRLCELSICTSYGTEALAAYGIVSWWTGDRPTAAIVLDHLRGCNAGRVGTILKRALTNEVPGWAKA